MKKPASMKPVAKAGGSPKAAPAKTVAKSSGSKNASIGYPAEDKRWKTEDAMRTLMRAEELKKDKSLMRDVEALAKEQAQKLSGLCGKGK